jgi:hypothetical protein
MLFVVHNFETFKSRLLSLLLTSTRDQVPVPVLPVVVQLARAGRSQ